jgi:hypothetical protein
MSDIQKERIQKFLANAGLTDWERNFAASITSYMEKHGRLSNKQWSTFEKAEARYCPEVIAQREAWNSSFSDEMRQKWSIAMDYYENNPPYFQDLVTKYRISPEMIPTAKLYSKIVENKYVQNVIATIQSEPLYEVGCLVQVRRTAKGPHYRFRDCIALVVDNSGPVTSATRGAKTYSILPFGETAPVKIQERWLKRKRG